MWILSRQCCQPLKYTWITHVWFRFSRSKREASRLRSNRLLRAASAACLLTHTLSNKALRDPRVAAGHAQWPPRLWASHGAQFAAPNLTAFLGESGLSGPSEVKVAQSCPTFWDPMDCSPPGSSVHGILQARILKWVVIPFFRGIFPTQRSNSHLLRLLHWRAGSLPPAPHGKPHPERSRSEILHMAMLFVIIVSFLPFMGLLKSFLFYIGI